MTVVQILAVHEVIVDVMMMNATPINSFLGSVGGKMNKILWIEYCRLADGICPDTSNHPVERLCQLDVHAIFHS